MAQKIVFIPGVGEVTLAKRRGTTNIRLSINAAGKIRVGLPSWTPYAAGITFVKSKSEWISKQLAHHAIDPLQEGDLIGKAHRLHFLLEPDINAIKTKVAERAIYITSDLSFDHPKVQSRALAAAERSLKNESSKLLPKRLEQLALKNGFSYKDVRVRKLTARWGSCSSAKAITLSYYLIQLPWHLIDYVLLHELSHTEHLHHGKDFWERFTKALPDARKMQKEIRNYRPVVKPYKEI
jgi:predicted metal-dependent hydrolase